MHANDKKTLVVDMTSNLDQENIANLLDEGVPEGNTLHNSVTTYGCARIYVYMYMCVIIYKCVCNKEKKRKKKRPVKLICATLALPSSDGLTKAIRLSSSLASVTQGSLPAQPPIRLV